MSDIAISVQDLGKNYIIGHKKEGDFRHAVGNKLKNIFKPDASEKEVFWALKDINFEIKHGEAVGIIGRNGAGKSTLLKILSRITDPSTGRFEINGRVSSLLEVGTGFHAELSGRENIYLNGTILGMKRAEIRQKFDEIVDFSGVEKFLDTPVKHYSSGMKVRLAFSVAAHLEPEILIVDEVLAVGDAEFQKKCLGKMDEVSKNEGRTILFVSHNMGSLKKLCDIGILLESGLLRTNGKLQDAVNDYLPKNKLNSSFHGNNIVRTVDILDKDNKNQSKFSVSDQLKVRMLISPESPIFNPHIGVVIKDHQGAALAGFNNLHYLKQSRLNKIIENSHYEVLIPRIPFSEGRYCIDIFISEGIETLESVKDQIYFEVIDDRVLELKLNPDLNKVLVEDVQWIQIK